MTGLLPTFARVDPSGTLLGMSGSSLTPLRLWPALNLPAQLVRNDAANTFTVGPQTIRSGADANKGLIVKANSATQSANLMELQDSSGAVITSWGPVGQITTAKLPASSVGNSIIFGASDGNLITFNPSRDLGVTSFQSWHDGGMRWFSTTKDGNSYRDLTVGMRTFALQGQVSANSVLTSSQDFSATATNPHLVFQKFSSTNTRRSIGSIDTVWVVSTDASRTGRLVHQVFDTAGREYMRGEASGSEAMLSFYGVAATARQLLATGAGHTVDDVITALQTLGLLKQS